MLGWNVLTGWDGTPGERLMRQRRALRLIGGAFLVLAAYLTVQSVLVLVTGYRPGHSVLGSVGRP